MLCYIGYAIGIFPSLPKNEFGELTISYISHEISAEGFRAMPKIAKSVQELPFPTTLKRVQAKESFEILKRKIVSTPLLRHPDRYKPFVIIPHANRWAACARPRTRILPVRFTGRVLNETVIRYHEAEKEVIAIMRALDVFENLVRGCPIKVYTRYSSKRADGRCVRWEVILSHWDLEVHKVQSDEDGLAAIMGAGITPREHLDEVAESLIPLKGRVKPQPVISVEMLEADFDGYVLSFDGAVKTSTRQGSCGCIIWKLPGWKVVTVQGFVLEDVTVNDAEYHGLLKGLTMVAERDIPDVVVVGDSRIVIQQVQGLINCNQPHLQRRLAEYGVLREKFKSVRLVHVKREYNQAADYLTSKTLAAGESWVVTDPAEMTHLEYSVVVLDSEAPARETPPCEPTSVQPGPESAPIPTPVRIMTAVTRSHARGNPSQSDPMGPLEYQADRWRRIKAHQDEDHRLKKFLRGEVDSFSRAQIRRLSKEADLFVLDSGDVLFRLNHSAQGRPRDQTDMLRLAVPETLRQDILPYAHEDVQGGHQGITHTHEKFRTDFYWYGMYADVEAFVKECIVLAERGAPNQGPSPGNIDPTHPFEIVSMDFVTHLPESARGNTFLLLFQDMFSGYVMCKPMSSTTAQEVAEAYEERVFQMVGASSMIRHDQDPRFMDEVFRQRATLGYMPQANGQQERSVQTVIRSKSDWDVHVERLMFALNTSFDATRLNTPFYLVHGWDAQGTVLAMLGPKPSGVVERTAAITAMRKPVQKAYSGKPSEIERSPKPGILSDRTKAGFSVGDAIWLYIPKAQPGLSHKLAHLWHGPFRIAEVTNNFRVRLKIDDTGYRVNPWVHISRLKPRALLPKRPTVRTEIDDDDDLDAALLPEDSWEVDNTNNEYEVEEILDLRWSKRTRTSKRIREYLVKWRGYDEPDWMPLSQLSCGALLYEFNQGAKARARFRAIQAGDDHPR
ncbi:LOW QUALITY PROTEIN: reverse transcriptase [Phytophthora megakarya]|uniref:Reverse transcriptase n=1 Tax=Phytophthora megakarya TaxID=4795 RepID=A0A225VYB2_9STRA|nr:LOW QUALITY PROTEIN: reverse transcriptase [Phytophthora megakarya]